MDSFFHQNRLNHALKKWSTHTLQWVANWEIQLAHERKTFKITWNNNREFILVTVKFNVIKNDIKSIQSVCTEDYCARGYSFYSGKGCQGGVFTEQHCSERLFIPDFEQGKFLSFPRIKWQKCDIFRISIWIETAFYSGFSSEIYFDRLLDWFQIVSFSSKLSS